MDWLYIGKFVAALVFVVCLMGGLAFILRMIEQKSGKISLIKDMQSKRRLQIMERLVIDRQKTALILRVDGVEHLIISGPQGETIKKLRHDSKHHDTNNQPSDNSDNHQETSHAADKANVTSS